MTNSESPSPSRRNVLKAGALLLAGCHATSGVRGEGGQVDLRVAGYPFDRVQALASGKVAIEGHPAQFDKSSIYELNAVAMGGDQRWHIQEIGLHPFMLAFANDAFRDYTLVPVFPLRTFRHKSIFVHVDRGIRAPEDLRGKKVGVAGYSQSSLVWIRGLLQHEYDVKPEDLQWVVSNKSSDGGLASKNEARVPKSVRVTRGPAGKDESELLVDGAVDAVLSAKEPQAFVDGDPKIARLFPDARRVERAYYKKTNLFPMMHVVAIRNDVVAANPDLPLAVYDAYVKARDLNYAFMNDLGWAMNALPWYAQELEETRALMGEDFWPYGIEANRLTLDTFFQYSHEQGLCDRRLSVEELFHSSTLKT